jgi:hypothetical protein
MKVCAEVQDVIAVGDTGGGSGLAAIVKATSTTDMLGPDVQKRLEIREIFAIALKKKW